MMNLPRLSPPLFLFCCLMLLSPSLALAATEQIALPALPQLKVEEVPSSPPEHPSQPVATETSPAPLNRSPREAKPRAIAEQGLDIVLVMDSSGSMKKNDPNDLRKPAAKLLISLLGKDDRASIVSFSDDGYPVAYLTGTHSASNNDLLFKAVEKISNKGAYTNLAGAIKAATRVYEQAWDSQRKHVVVLMSDGKVDLASAVEDEKATAELITKLLPVLKEKQIQVYTIAFTDNSDMRLLQGIANLTDGHFNIARTDKDLHQVFASIFEQSKEPDILPMRSGRFSVDHNVREMTIIANKASLDTRVSLTLPSGRVLESDRAPADIKWLVSDQFDLITIQNPEPGEWAMLPEGEANRAYIITDLKMALHVLPEQPQRGDRLEFNIWLEDDGHLLSKQEVLSALRVDLVENLPSGHSQRIALQGDRAANGTLSGYYRSDILLNEYGRYRIEVTASTGTFDRVKSKVIDLTPPMKPQEVLNALEDPNSTVLQPLAGAEHVYTVPPPVEHPPQPAVTPAPVVPAVVEYLPEESDAESGVLLAVIIFIIFNLILAAGGGIIWWVQRRKSIASQSGVTS
ncbi:MAG: VWA domain-containing protein [Gammaproteobacteria bacterium]|nr:VWA domain-containing protein [Gammaproteobacteria bacterium]